SELPPLAKICPLPCPRPTLRPPISNSTACTTARTLAVVLVAPFAQESSPLPTVANLFRASRRRLPMEELTTAEVVSDFGFAGCTHARPRGKRQVLLVDKETLDAMELHPGIVRENITSSGLNVNGLVLGEHLRIADVLLEVSAVCTPCDQ